MDDDELVSGVLAEIAQEQQQPPTGDKTREQTGDKNRGQRRWQAELGTAPGEGTVIPLRRRTSSRARTRKSTSSVSRSDSSGSPPGSRTLNHFAIG